MSVRMHVGRAMAVCAFVVLGCTNAYAQTATATERPNGSRPVRGMTDGEGLRTSGGWSLRDRVSSNLREWRWHPVDSSRERWSVLDGDRASVSKGHSRKKAVLIGAAIGGGVGAGGGAYAVYATGGDADPWVVPAFGGIGAAVGAACGFLISLF